MAEKESSVLLDEVAAYYSAKLAEHGETARGVDWNGPESQNLRFEQLARVIDRQSGFSIADVGCGYGALYDFLAPIFSEFQYTGCDISAPMVAAAQARHGLQPAVRYLIGSEPPEAADFAVASGVFNVRLDQSDADWLTYIHSVLDVLNAKSRSGFAFNCLTSYSDADKIRSYLYYADPCMLFDYCKRKYSRDIALLHDYGLYEFTILVRK